MFDNIELLAFIKENLAFARTIVIKHEDVAVLDNRMMHESLGIVTPSDKTQWRYYLNLNGDYHATDDMMVVQSLDDNEQINFTKDVLERHPATKKAYRLGSYYFSRLAAKYPHQIDLIQGIINPIPPEESIAAKPYQILRYTKDYVHWNESQLIPALQQHIYQTTYQSFQTEYKYTDDLMLPFLIAHLRESVFKFLLVCRFEHRYSRHAHPFYIWSHLQSMGISPIYKDLLNNKQTMWLFRNIEYVLRNLGKTSTFEALMDILLTERNIPLAKYDLVQSTEDMAETLVTEPLFYTERMNLIDSRGLGQTFNSVSSVMLKEIPESIDNEVNYDKYLPRTVDESRYNLISTYPVKILDSELVDVSNRKSEIFFHVLNNELIYLAGNNLYNINLDIEEPLTGLHQRITVKDAIVLWHHLLNRYNGADCDKIPAFYYQEVLKIKPVSLETMLSVGTKPFLSEEWCRDVLKTVEKLPQIRMIAPSTFYENALAIFNLKWDHKKMYSRWPSIGYYSQRKNAISTAYETGFIRLTDKKTYTEFLTQFNLDLSTYRKEDCLTLMWEIWRKATGWDNFSHITLEQIQSGMIGLMRFLSSYSVQYIHQTTMEDGWFEGGLDLLTENPLLLNHNTENAPELEGGTESSRLPVHLRIVNRDLEEENTFFGNAAFDEVTLESEMTVRTHIYETPLLYDVDIDDETDLDNGGYSNRLLDLTYKLRNFTGKLPYELEDLIPKGGSKGDQHRLKEMIVDTFEGKTTVGPWEAVGIRIVKNGLDNLSIADEVDGFDYDKIVNTKKLDGETNRYYIGFSPEEMGEHVIKLDIIIRNTQTQEINTIRFDYPTQTQPKSWMLSFDIPSSISLNTPFTITPTITGLDLNGKTITNEQYWVYDTIQPYLSVNYQDGRLTGEFLKEAWPDELPVMYVLTTTTDGDDVDSSTHTYFMLGLIPSDRYYDPLLDPEFEPRVLYNEADRFAITVERFAVTAEHHGWEATSLYIKKNEDGTYPVDQIKTDYQGIADYLTPRLAETPYLDTTIKGVTTRTFEWEYAANADELNLTLIVELTNKKDGSVVERSFTYSPTVIDHHTTCELAILPEPDFKFGIGYSTATALTVTGLGEEVTLVKGGNPTLTPNQVDSIAIDYSPSAEVVDNHIQGYVVRPYKAIKQNAVWAVKLEAVVRTTNGAVLTVKPYSTITILTSEVINYDTINPKDVKYQLWGNNTFYTYAEVPTRFAIGDFTNGWYIESIELLKDKGNWPVYVGTTLPGISSDTDLTGFEPKIVVSRNKDGDQEIPAGFTAWFTLTMLANIEYAKQFKTLNIPLQLNVKHRFTGKTGSAIIAPPYKMVEDAFPGVKQPPTLPAGKSSHLTPVWDNVPLSQFGGNIESSEGIFIGVNSYKGGENQDEVATAVWNGDRTAEVVIPSLPLTRGKGIKLYNKIVYLSDKTAFKGTSLEKVTYYPYVQYDDDEVGIVPLPAASALDFTLLPVNDAFLVGVRSTCVVLINPESLTEFNWAIANVQLQAYGTDKQDSVMMTSLDDVDLTRFAYETGEIDISRVSRDVPNGKEHYLAYQLGFIPVKSGNQTYDVTVTLVNNSGSEALIQDYPFTLSLSVKEKEGQIVYERSYPDPYWLVNEETLVSTELINATGNIESSRLMAVEASSDNKRYADFTLDRYTPLNPDSPVLSVKVFDTFKDNALHVQVVHQAKLGNYGSDDPRGYRRYFDTLLVNPDHTYTLNDLNKDSVDIQPDIVFNPMGVNQSYTERYVYNVNTYGWTVEDMRLREDAEWQNQYFTYKGATYYDESLVNLSRFNVLVDGIKEAPEGKQYYLPMYGGRRVDQWDVVFAVQMVSQHHKVSNSKTFDYTFKRDISGSDIWLNVSYDTLYAGKTNDLKGGLEGVPGSDLNSAMRLGDAVNTVVSPEGKYFSVTDEPYAVSIEEGYPIGNGQGALLGQRILATEVKEGQTLETYTWCRAYRGEYVLPDESIVEFIDYPDFTDFDFTPLQNVTFYQGVRSTYLTLLDVNKINQAGWTITNVSLENEEEILTHYADKDIGTVAYECGISDPTINDKPAEKKDYQCCYASFIPAKTGVQTFGVVVSIADKATNSHFAHYTVNIMLDVQDKVGNIAFDDDWADPWWLAGKETLAVVTLSDTPTGLIENNLSYIGLNTQSSHLISARIATDSELSARPVLGITVPDKILSPDATVIVGFSTTFSGYNEDDPRKEKVFVEVLTIKADRTYELSELDIETIGFKPNVVFEEMTVNQSYTERYVYEQNVRGWVMTTVRLKEQADWMNHIFEYEEDTLTIPSLFNNALQDVTLDMTQEAPEGSAYYLPTYGGRKAGQQTIDIDLLLVNKHIPSADDITKTYQTQRNIVNASINLAFTYDKFYIGKTNGLEGGLTGVPTSDINSVVTAGEHQYVTLGKNKSYVSLSENPLTATVSESYPEGKGEGITLGAVVLYDTAKDNETIESATWKRGYRGQQLIPASDFTVKIEYPEVSDFDMTVLSSPMFEGVSCTLGFAYATTSATQKGWTCANNGLTVYGTDQQSTVMSTVIEGKTFEDTQVYTFGTKEAPPVGSPAPVAAYQYGYVTFIPAKSGTQTITVDILLKHESSAVNPTVLSFPLTVNVNEKEGVISYTKETASAWFPMGKQTGILTELSGYSGTLVSNVLSVATPAPDAQDYLNATLGYSSTLKADALLIESVKEFDNVDRHVIVGHTVRVDGYDEGDERAVRTYYDSLTVDQTHVYDIEHPKPELIDLQADIVFEEMEQFTSYTERYSYLRESSSGWTLKSTRIVEDTSWMNHIFEYDGQTSTSAQLYTSQKDKVTVDRTISAPPDRWFSLPVYGSRKLGEFEVTLEVVITTKQFGSTQDATITLKQKRKVIDAGIRVEVTYDELAIGKTNKITVTKYNIPRDDLHAGVTTSAVSVSTLGKAAGYFTYKGNPSTLTIDADYPVNGHGVMLTFVYPYKGRSSAFPDSSETNNRVYRAEMIIPDTAITNVSFPTLEDLDFTPLGNVDFFKGVKSSYVTLYNSKVNQYDGWWISDVRLAVMGTTQQADTIITTVDGKDLTDKMYETGTYYSYVNDVPAGKENYDLIHTAFVPAKAGLQSFDVVITASIDSSNGTVTKEYTYAMNIDVKPQEGEIIYNAAEPSPYWLVGTQTFAMTDIINVSGNVQQKSLDYAQVTDEFASLLSAKTGINNALTADVSLAVTVKDRFTDITPRVMTAYEVVLNGYAGTDPRRNRMYFGTLPINADALYDREDITLEKIGFKPDVVFETMVLNEVYTERFVYNQDTIGWEVKTARLVEDYEWMAHIFEYDNDRRADYSLFVNNAQNKVLDKTIFADDDKYFYLPRYGSRSTGEKEITIEIVLNNRHLAKSVETTVTYKAKRNVADAGIRFNLTHDQLKVGETTNFSGDLAPVPQPDVGYYITEKSDNIMLVGSRKSFFTMGRYPYKLTIDSSYPAGSANGVMMVVTKAFTKDKPGVTVLTETTYRYYRGTYVVTEDSIERKRSGYWAQLTSARVEGDILYFDYLPKNNDTTMTGTAFVRDGISFVVEGVNCQYESTFNGYNSVYSFRVNLAANGIGKRSGLSYVNSGKINMLQSGQGTIVDCIVDDKGTV